MVDPFKLRTGKNAPAVMYLDLLSSITPVPHCSELPIATISRREQQCLQRKVVQKMKTDPEFRDATEERNPYTSIKKTSMT